MTSASPTSRRPVELGDVLELGRGPILVLRVVDLVETGPQSPLAALMKVARCADGRALEGVDADDDRAVRTAWSRSL
jgi:hypothetical protein